MAAFRPLLRDTGTLAALVLGFLAAACSSAPRSVEQEPSPEPPAEARGGQEGRVVAVEDAVTIRIDLNGAVVRVRYLGVELPRSDAAVSEPLVEQATEYNRFLVRGRVVQLQKGGPETDETGALLRYVYADGEMVNLALLASGYAVVSSYPPVFQLKDQFLMAEAGAREAKKGLWNGAKSLNGQAKGSAPVYPTPSTGTYGTLPMPPAGQASSQSCDYSNASTPVIKGNISADGQWVYHVPGGLFYDTVEVKEEEGDRWFCTEADAIASGWTRSKR